MNLLDRLIAWRDPVEGLRRARARTALALVMNYNATTTGKRGSSWRRSASDADAAAGRRNVLAFVARDMIRNTPFATRAQAVIVNNVVGDGIVWKIETEAKSKANLKRLRQVLKQHLDSTAIDADGRQNLYGLQRLALNTVVESGEVLIRRRRRGLRDGLTVPLQLQVMEPDFIDTSRDGSVPGAGKDNTVREGIEYDPIGRRVAYWLFPEHPGSTKRLGPSYMSRRVPAAEILHIYRQDRPGQMRGVSWFAPVALAMQDLMDAQDAHLMRQKIAACFAGFRVALEDERVGDPANKDADGEDNPGGLNTLVPGRIQTLRPGEDIRFSSPPGVEGFDAFTKMVLQSAASGLGITYEALTGDLSNVNFSSGRMGRMEMDRNVSSWQWLMLVPQMMQPVGRWVTEALTQVAQVQVPRDLALAWVPPHRMMVDPSREITALRDKVKAGFASRQGVVRELGFDPEDLTAEQIEDMEVCRKTGLRFDSDVSFQSQFTGESADPDTGETAGQGGGATDTDKEDDDVRK
ncbi:phage portal protein [Novosphingobium sp.]|uniref:phage portal protein n=1 Tax=Novosphingobium sp. TaxID=1874826 RepID=UPI0026116A46|nr:phage portal protein [Novosphingobium sp.]